MSVPYAVACACLAAALLVVLPMGIAVLSIGALVGAARGIVSTPLARPASLAVAQLHGSAASPGSGQAVRSDAPVLRASGLVAGWMNRPPINQYARSNYRSDQDWLTWRDADCSAAALAWILAAYGRPVGALDETVTLIGAGTGISPRLGLLDARGPALARALAARGLPPRTPGARPLAARTDLQLWLDQGPLLMDGARWFGEGHWFVAIGYDAGGIQIRDSSGWDTRYLSWSNLYGEVGFSGWVLGVAS